MAKLTLSALVAATLASGFTYATINDVKSLVASGDAEQDTDVAKANPANAKEFPVRATDAGIAKQKAADEKAAASAAPTFTFITGPALAKEGRKGGRANKYPFADFPAPSTGSDGSVITAKIFVPATAKMPDPVKSLSSTVSEASRSFANVIGTKPSKDRSGKDIQRKIYEFTRKFAIVAGEQTNPETGEVTKGAYIERVM